MSENGTHSKVMQLSRLANRLLLDLEAVEENALQGDNTHPRKMEVVLEAFFQIDLMMERIHASEHKHSSKAAREDR